VEGRYLMPLLIALAAGAVLVLADIYRGKPGDPL
jgi:hypothetical protein